MNVTIFKRIISLIFIVSAFITAVTTNASEKKKFSPVIGYISDLDHGLCSVTVKCGYSNSSICTAVFQGRQEIAFGKLFNEDVICIVPLFRNDW